MLHFVHPCCTRGEYGAHAHRRGGPLSLRPRSPSPYNAAVPKGPGLWFLKLLPGGSCHCKWASACVSGRREEAKGGTQRCRDTAFTWCVWKSPRSQCGQGELVFLALAGRAVRRLGESAPRWPAGSPAQWQRPRMWICVGPRDPDTKPSRGCLRVVELGAIPQLPP